MCVQKCIYTELLEQNRNQTVPLVKEESGILATNHLHSCFCPTNLTAIEEIPVCQEDSPTNWQNNNISVSLTLTNFS